MDFIVSNILRTENDERMNLPASPSECVMGFRALGSPAVACACCRAQACCDLRACAGSMLAATSVLAAASL